MRMNYEKGLCLKDKLRFEELKKELLKERKNKLYL